MKPERSMPTTIAKQRAPRPLPVPGWVRPSLRAAGTVWPGMAAEVARRLFFRPLRLPRRDAEREILERGARFEVPVRSRSVTGWAWGTSGPPVLLLHGWGGHAGQLTALVDPLLAAGLRPVAIDAPAHGDSPGRLSSLVHFEAAMVATGGLFGPWRGIVAHSFGAAATTLAISPDRRSVDVERLVFLAPPSNFESFWRRFRHATGVSETVWRRLLRDSERRLGVEFERIHPVLLAPRLRIPLLVQHSEDDREMPIEEAENLVAAWPGARLERLEKLGHIRLLRDPETIGRTVRFLGEA